MSEPVAGLTARFRARPEGLDDLHAALERFFAAADHAGASIRTTDRVALATAAAEVASNIVAYACRQIPDAEVVVALCRREDRVEARFEDPGAARSERDPDPVDPVPHLGLGLKIARSCVDALEYARKDGTNHWRLVRLTSGT